MKPRWIFPLLFALVLSIPAVHAQTGDCGPEGCSQAVCNTWDIDTDCQARALQAIQAICADSASLPVGYSSACQSYAACRAEENAEACQMRGLLAAESACAESDRRCLIRARLDAAAVPLMEAAFLNPYAQQQAADLPAILLSALQHFDAGDDRLALRDVQSIAPEIAVNPLVSFSIGLIADASGEIETARGFYDTGISQILLDPFAYYVRADFLARTGAIEEAAADTANLRRSAEAAGVVLPDSLLSAYPETLIPFEKWMAYPVYYQAGGGGSGIVLDESLMDAYPVDMVVVSDGMRLITGGLSRLLGGTADIPAYLNFAVQENGDYRYTNGYTDAWGSWSMDIVLNLNVPVQVTETRLDFESSATVSYLLAPIDQPDPRLNFEITRCGSGAFTRLGIGAVAFGNPLQPGLLYDAPGGSAIDTQPPQMRVLEGPECVDNQTWWYVKGDGENAPSGWVAENDSIAYLISALNVPVFPPMMP